MHDHQITPEAVPLVGFGTTYGQARGPLTMYECRDCGAPLFFDSVSLSTNEISASCEQGHWVKLAFQRSQLRKL